MNYEFHVGDYVEAAGGFVGWISDIKDNNYIVITDKANDSRMYHLPRDDKYFLRIGEYDFTKKEKKKIDNLVKPQWTVSVTDFIDKINELVDAVNKLMDDYDKHIKAHEQVDR